jgi:phosphoribosylformylglycinamidine synthase II
MRPTVQVGDPFAEKLLLEATLELIEADVVVAVQDMGAAGICCSTSEMSARTDVGMDVDLDKVPMREKGMSAYEIMLSESQERMLFIIEKGKEEKAIEICDKWDVPITLIGIITNDGILNIRREGKTVVQMDAEPLVLGGGAPQNDPKAIEPKYLKETRAFDTTNLKTDISLKDAFFKLISTPTIASKRWIFEQYDSQVRTNSVNIKGDAAVIRLKELPGKGIALCTDCNSRYTYLNPYNGAMSAVAEAARNVVCVGAEPVAITNCLNFGNPDDPEVFWTFKEAIKGMGDACRALGTPVTGGNVSFHNESRNRAVNPTPTIGMLGLIDDLNKTMSLNFKKEGDEIYILGNDRQEFGGSEYLKQIHGTISGEAPIIDIEEEKRLQKATLTAIRSSVVNSAHDTAEGGIAVCLAEKSFGKNKLGCEVELSGELTAAKLFGESQSRIVVSLDSAKVAELKTICDNNNVPMTKLGTVVNDKFEIKGCFETTVAEIEKEYEDAIPSRMQQ